MDMRKLGARIKRRREKRHLRQSDIASALRISAQAVSKWERGENAPDISLLLELAQLLDVSVEWLLGGTAGQTDTFEATVFCTNLSGFAAKSAGVAPREVADWINVVYYSVTEAMLRYDGVPIKYVGDGFLGFFAGGNQAQRALQAARQALMSLDSRDLSIALNKGEIFLGTIGHPDYARLDILGQTVNTAFLVLPWIAENCKTRIGLTQTVREALDESVTCVRRGQIDLLGAAAPFSIYEPEIEQ